MVRVDAASLHESALEVRRTAKLRLVFGLVACSANFGVLGYRHALVWLTFYAAGEVWLWTATARSKPEPNLWRQASRLACAFYSSTVWTSLGVMLWLNGDAMSQAAGAATWASLLIHVASSSNRVPPLALATATPIVSAMLACPLLFPMQHSLLSIICVEFALALCIVHAATAGMQGYHGHRQIIAQREKAFAASRAKTDFLATMSHEIRTPLNGVIGMSEAMVATDMSPTQREYMDIILSSGKNLLAILNDVLDLAKIEAGKLELEHAPFDLAELAQSVQGTFSALATGKGVHLSLTISDASRGAYISDAKRIGQVLSNLVSNALKFTKFGEVGIEVFTIGDGVQFVVSDTGVGIPADRLPKLFEKFEQANASTSRQYGGTGLGLAICRELAEALGGSIRAESIEGVGTKFFFFLPLVRLEDQPVSTEDAIVIANQPYDLDTLHVLAAEDNAVNQIVLKTILNQVGVDPVMVGNGAEAVAAWREAEWGLILMDVQMPVMDGPTASRTIRELERASGRKRTPIIALTANAMSQQVADYLEAGMDGVTTKPIAVGRLLAEIDRVLGAQAYPPPRAGVFLPNQGTSTEATAYHSTCERPRRVRGR